MSRSVLFFVFLAIVVNIKAQYHNHVWYLGFDYDPIIQFGLVTNNPTVSNGHVIPFTDESNAVATDPSNGQVLFFTNSEQIWDMSNTPMPNGAIAGSSTSVTSAQLASNEANCNQIYVFYNDANRAANTVGSLQYALVDITLPGNGSVAFPQGDIPPGQKDIPLYNNCSEAIEIAKGPNSNRYWLYVVSYDGDSLLWYSVDQTGVNYVQAVQLPVNLTAAFSIRHSSVSNKLAIVSMVESEPVLVADYNPATGAVTNIVQVPGSILGPSNTAFEGNYDAEWSPDGTKLYFTKWRYSNGNGGAVFQYDLNNPATPAGQVYTNGNNSNNLVGGIKLGPDDLIYFIRFEPGSNYRFLGAISNPNAAGIACNPIANSLDLTQDMGLSVKISETLLQNLPPVTNQQQVIAPCTPTFNGLQADVIATTVDGDNSTFSLSIDYTSPSITASVVNGLIEISSVTPQNGPDTVRYIVCDDHCFPRCDTNIVIVIPPVPFGGVLPSDTIICAPGQSIELNTGLPNMIPQTWSTGDMDSIIQVSNAGVYWVDIVGLNGCQFRDSTVVQLYQPPNLGLNRLICSNIPPILDATCSGCSYLWSTGSTAGSIAPTQPGNYWVQVTSQCGVGSDTVTVTSSVQPFVELGPDRLVCDTADLFIDYSCLGCYYLVNDQAADSSLTIEASGTYWVEVGNDCGTVYDTVTLVMGANAEFNILDDSLVCPGDTAYLTSAGAVAPYTWSDGSTGDTLMITERGWYSLSWTGVCGETTDSVFIKQLLPSEITLGDDFTVCDSGFAPIYIENLGDDAEYLWWNGTTGDTAYVFREDNYVVRVDYCADFYTDTIFVRYTDETDGLFIPNTFTPNGDGLNEIFYIRGLDPAWLSFEFLVFDRWGQIVYQTDDPRKGWEGLDPSGANKLDDGSYVYKVIYTSPCRSEWEYTGVVNMIR